LISLVIINGGLTANAPYSFFFDKQWTTASIGYWHGVGNDLRLWHAGLEWFGVRSGDLTPRMLFSMNSIGNILSGNQTWLAGKCLIIFHGNIIYT
jgi:hypothetical protein